MISEQGKGGFKEFIHNNFTDFVVIYQTFSLFSKIWNLMMKNY